MVKYWWLIAFIVVGVLLGAGVLLLVTSPPRGEAIELLPPPTTAPIVVDIRGGVMQSGLYTLPPGSRVNDAIQAAGGFSSGANTTGINLADLLEDGEQIDVPYLPPTPAPESETTAGNQTTEPPVVGGEIRTGSQLSILVDINTATLEQLDNLPEIGPKTAQKIIDYRNANGPFATIEEILDVSGIGPLTFSRIKDLITVGTSP